MAVDVGTFGIPGNFATPYYSPTTNSYDMPGLRKYLRGQLPPNRFNFTDEQLDKLISGEGLPGNASMYDLQAGGPQGSARSSGSSGANFKIVDGSLTETEEERTEPSFGDGDGVEVVTTATDDVQPPPPEPVIVADSVLGKSQRDLSQAYYDPNTGGIRGTFYGSYGTRIDPDTGAVVPGTEPYTAPLFDPGAAFVQRTGPEGQDLGTYNDLFPIYLYGGAPSNALVELDRYGLGLDFVRANPALLQQWWTDVFKPVYFRYAGTGTGSGWRPVAEDEPSAWNPANIIRYLANPLSLLFGAGGSGPVGDAAVDLVKSFGGVDPQSLQLDLPLTPDSLLGQIFDGTGLTIAPGTSQAVLNALGNIDIPVEAFAPENRDRTIEYLSDFFPEGSIPIGENAFAPGNIDLTREFLVDALGDIVVGAGQFRPEEGTVESLLKRLGVIEVGSGLFKPAPGALEALQAYFPNVKISPESFSPENIAATKDVLRNELGRIFVNPDQFSLGTGYTVGRGPFSVQDKLLDDLGDIAVDPKQFTVDDPASVVNALRNLIPDIAIDPSKFQLGTDTVSGYERTPTEKLLDDIGVIEVAPNQFAIEDVNKAASKLVADLGYIEVGPGKFQLGTGGGGLTPEQKLLQDLDIIKVGPEGFELDDTAAIKLSLLNNLGMINVGVAESGMPGFTLDPAAAGILRNQLVTAINPLTADDFRRDPELIANEIRADIVNNIDAITQTDIGADTDQIKALLDPLRSEVAGLPGEVEKSAISPIQELFAALEEQGRALPETFRQDVQTPIADMIEGLRTSLTQDIGEFQVPDTFLEKGTKRAESLLDLIYGTGMGTGREGAGIAGFQIPPAFAQLESRLGSFDAPETLMGKVGLLQDALRGIDLSTLTAPEGLDALVANVGQLGTDLPGAATGLETFQNALGAFSAEDQAVMGMLLNLIGPEGIASLGTEQLADLITRFKEMQGTALTDAMSAFYASDTDVQPWLDALRRGVVDTYYPIPEYGFEGLIPGLVQGISDKYEPTFKRAAGNIQEIQDILENFEEGNMQGTGTTEGTGTTPTGFLATLQNALSPRIKDQSALTADYLAGDPVTASLLADLADQQKQQQAELEEQLQRFGVIQSGASLDAIPELQSLQRRERLGVLGSAAERIQAERDQALAQGLDLGKTLTTRDLGLAELTGLAGDTQTLGGREADLDIISAVIAALDPELEIEGNKEELAELLLELLGNVPGGEDANWIARFKNMVMEGEGN